MGRTRLLLAAAPIVAACGGAPDTPPAVGSAPRVYTPRALTATTFERTPARRERGEYLVTGPLQCFMCHSPRDWSKPGAPPVTGRAGAGRVWSDDQPWLVAPNLTPDTETGMGRRTDDMLVRSIREGVAHDGRVLHPQMWSSSFRRLSDEDVASVVVYLRSLKPVRNPLPATQIPADVAKDLKVPEPITAPVPPPDVTTPIARARYLAVRLRASSAAARIRSASTTRRARWRPSPMPWLTCATSRGPIDSRMGSGSRSRSSPGSSSSSWTASLPVSS